MDKEMQRALMLDAEKLGHLTGEDHTPEFLADCEECDGGLGTSSRRSTFTSPAADLATQTLNKRRARLVAAAAGLSAKRMGNIMSLNGLTEWEAKEMSDDWVKEQEAKQRRAQLRIQALGAAISRRDWHADCSGLRSNSRRFRSVRSL